MYIIFTLNGCKILIWNVGIYIIHGNDVNKEQFPYNFLSSKIFVN